MTTPWIVPTRLRSLVVVTVLVMLVAVSAADVQGALRAAATSPTSITLNWTAPGDDGNTGTAAVYDIRYSSSTITEANWASANQASGEPTPLPAGSAQTFEVTGLTPSTSYYFAIKTADEAGNWSALSNVVLKSTDAEATAPSAIANLAAPSSTLNSVTITWTAPGDDGTTGTATTYDIRYSTATITEANWASATQATGEPSPKAAGQSETFTVSGLSATTTYYFAVKTADEVPNWSAISNVASRATSAESTAPATVANLATSSSNESSVTLTWTAPGDDGTTGTATTYDIRYSTATITAANFNSATQVTGEPTPLVAGSSQTMTVTGLNSNTTYFFALKTADEVPNWSAISNVPSRATTAETTAPAAVANLATSSSTANSVTLTWTAPGDDGSTGTATTYDIRYSTSSITNGNFNSAAQATGEPTPLVAGQSQTFTVTGLNPSTTYYFALKTADEVPNWSAISNVPSRATGSETTAPAAVANLTTTASTSSSVTLTWTAPGDDGSTGTATTYDLRYSTAAITDANFASATQVTGEPTPLASGNSQTMTVTGLNSSTTYYFALKTADEVPNWSALSNVPSRATSAEATAPAAIANLGAGSETASTVTLSWTAPGDDGNLGTATTYDIRYSTAVITDANFASATQVSGEPSPRAAGQAESFVVSGLNGSTMYYFAIKTADEVPNWSALSNVVNRATTTETTPPRAISDLLVASSTNTSVTLTWTAPGDDGSVGTASVYDVRFSTSPITTASFATDQQATGEPTPRAVGTVETFTVTGLTPGTTYYFAVKSADEVPNWSNISNMVGRTTSGDGTAPSAINDLSALPGDNEGELILGWTAVGDDELVGTATAYTIWLAESELTDSTWTSGSPYAGSPIPLPSGSTHAYTLTGLVPGQRYWVGVVTYDEVGNSDGISNIVNAEAKIDIGTGGEGTIAGVAYPQPNTVLNTSKPELAVLNITAATASSYLFEVATDSQFFSLVTEGSVPEDLDGCTEWKVDEPLNGGTVYYWRAKADDYPYTAPAAFMVNPAAHAYPNPAALAQYPTITFTDLPEGADLILLSPSGEQIRYWTDITGGDLQWDGTNASGNRVSSGTYLWYVADSEMKGKLVVIR